MSKKIALLFIIMAFAVGTAFGYSGLSHPVECVKGAFLDPTSGFITGKVELCGNNVDVNIITKSAPSHSPQVSHPGTTNMQ